MKLAGRRILATGADGLMGWHRLARLHRPRCYMPGMDIGRAPDYAQANADFGAVFEG